MNQGTVSSHHSETKAFAPSRNVYAISDLHVDYKENLNIITSLCREDYANDVLLVAGDVSDNLELLEVTLNHLQSVFHQVFFVPGNHELWIRRFRKKNVSQVEYDSIDKFNDILKLCEDLGVMTKPALIQSQSAEVHIVPLYSWYLGPEDGKGTLYVEKSIDKDKTHDIWGDYFLCQWPQEVKEKGIAHYFLELNKDVLQQTYHAPVISFSHFLPRTNLVFKYLDWRQKLGEFVDPMPSFNFTRVAGCEQIDEQLRTIGSQLHVYGHQHRDRHRIEEDVIYISHCLGYPKERLHRSEQFHLPKLVWSDGQFRRSE